MAVNILTTIKANYNNFSGSQKRIADFILKHPGNVLRMSISELADESRTSDATVSRFCREIKSINYKEFRFALAESLSSKPKEQESSGNILKSDPISVMTQKVLSREIRMLHATMDLFDEQLFSRAVDMMANAERIVFFGVGSSQTVVQDMFCHMLYLTPKVAIFNDINTQIMCASTMTPKEVAVIMTASGASKDTVNIAAKAKQRKAGVICITQFEKSPIIKYTDVALLFSSEYGAPVEDVKTQLAPYFLVNLLVSEYARRTFTKTKKNVKTTSEAIFPRKY